MLVSQLRLPNRFVAINGASIERMVLSDRNFFTTAATSECVSAYRRAVSVAFSRLPRATARPEGLLDFQEASIPMNVVAIPHALTDQSSFILRTPSTVKSRRSSATDTLN